MSLKSFMKEFEDDSNKQKKKEETVKNDPEQQDQKPKINKIKINKVDKKEEPVLEKKADEKEEKKTFENLFINRELEENENSSNKKINININKKEIKQESVQNQNTNSKEIKDERKDIIQKPDSDKMINVETKQNSQNHQELEKRKLDQQMEELFKLSETPLKYKQKWIEKFMKAQTSGKNNYIKDRIKKGKFRFNLDEELVILPSMDTHGKSSKDLLKTQWNLEEV